MKPEQWINKGKITKGKEALTILSFLAVEQSFLPNGFKPCEDVDDRIHYY